VLSLLIFESPKYGTTCTVHKSACNDSCYSRKDTIIYRMHIKRSLHSPWHKDLWLFRFLFWLLVYFLCSCYYSPSLVVLFNSYNVYFLLSITCVHSLPTCIIHYDYSMCCYAWETFFISSTHLDQCASIIS